MGSREHTSVFGEYSESTQPVFLKDDRITPALEERVAELSDRLLERLRKNEGADDGSVYIGSGGLAYLYFRMSERDPSYRSKALKLAQASMKTVSKKRYSFLNGIPGPLALAAVLLKQSGDTKKANQLIDELLSMASNVTADDNIPSEILYGKAGYLYSLLFVNAYASDGQMNATTTRQIVECIFEEGKALAKENPGYQTPLLYQWHEKFYLGAAHGMAGILYVLLSTKEVTPSELETLVRPSLNWLLKEKFRTGNYRSSLGSTRDSLVQWCHGAPGFTHLLLRAYQVFKDPAYLEAAKESGEVIWARGLLTKGYSICHGVSGNAYAFLALWNATKDRKYLYYAACFAQWATGYPKHEGMKPDRPNSLYEGIAGLALFLYDIQNPERAMFPAYEIPL